MAQRISIPIAVPGGDPSGLLVQFRASRTRLLDVRVERTGGGEQVLQQLADDGVMSAVTYAAASENGSDRARDLRAASPQVVSLDITYEGAVPGIHEPALALAADESEPGDYRVLGGGGASGSGVSEPVVRLLTERRDEADRLLAEDPNDAFRLARRFFAQLDLESHPMVGGELVAAGAALTPLLRRRIGQRKAGKVPARVRLSAQLLGHLDRVVQDLVRLLREHFARGNYWKRIAVLKAFGWFASGKLLWRESERPLGTPDSLDYLLFAECASLAFAEGRVPAEHRHEFRDYFLAAVASVEILLETLWDGGIRRDESYDWRIPRACEFGAARFERWLDSFKRNAFHAEDAVGHGLVMERLETRFTRLVSVAYLDA